MSPIELYLHLLKATATTFAGLASLPVIQADLVEHHHVLTNQQLNVSIVVTRSTPGPVGLWIVSAGYFAGGVWGAIAGWAAMISDRRRAAARARPPRTAPARERRDPGRRAR